MSWCRTQPSVASSRELEGSLARAGFPVRVGTFAETPTLIGWREGQEFSPLVLEGHRQSALVVILTDGYGMRLGRAIGTRRNAVDAGAQSVR